MTGRTRRILATAVVFGTLAGLVGTNVLRQDAQGEISLSALVDPIVFSRDDDIFSANADATNLRRLTRTRGPEEDPSWSPDGARIVYRDSRRGFNKNDEIYVMAANGANRRNLTTTLLNEWGPTWSPDGKLIAYNRSNQLYVMRPDGGGKHVVAKINGEYPAWSPDGKRLVFMSIQEDFGAVRDPNYDVFVVNVDGSGLRQLTDWRGEDGWADWSPDGKRIVYTTTRDNRGQFLDGHQPHRTLWVMDADGSDQRRLVDAWGSYPDWSRDGRYILFTRSPLARWDERLAVVRPDGSGLRWLPLRGTLADWIG